MYIGLHSDGSFMCYLQTQSVPPISSVVTRDAPRTVMAFFGITGLGYQAPLRAAQIQGDSGENENNAVKLPVLVPLSSYVSYGTYHERVRRHQDLRSSVLAIARTLPAGVTRASYQFGRCVGPASGNTAPKQSQRMPLTTAQQYGWWLPQEPMVKVDGVYPWSQTIRHPMINSPMTRFVDKMAVTNKGFRLF